MCVAGESDIPFSLENFSPHPPPELLPHVANAPWEGCLGVGESPITVSLPSKVNQKWGRCQGYRSYQAKQKDQTRWSWRPGSSLYSGQARWENPRHLKAMSTWDVTWQFPLCTRLLSFATNNTIKHSSQPVDKFILWWALVNAWRHSGPSHWGMDCITKVQCMQRKHRCY